jgi:hypothetical protein
MVDSFRISDSAGSSATQVQSSDGSREDNNGGGNCDRVSYPDPNICIPRYPPDLSCPDIPNKNFKVIGSDPHGFDRDNDGIGCESANEDMPAPTDPEPSICYFDPSDEECDPIDGKCPEGFGFNDDDRCIPHGKCPDGYGRLDDDETGTCYRNSDIKKCPDGYITHKDDDCPPPYEPAPEPPEQEPIGYCNPGLTIIDGICGPYLGDP